MLRGVVGASSGESDGQDGDERDSFGGLEESKGVVDAASSEIARLVGGGAGSGFFGTGGLFAKASNCSVIFTGEIFTDDDLKKEVEELDNIGFVCRYRRRSGFLSAVESDSVDLDC